MLITKKLEKELRETNAIVLLDDGKEADGKPRLVVRQVLETWGKCDQFKGGVCIAPLSDGTDHVNYETVAGYHTGRTASVQQLLLSEHACTFTMPFSEWQPFLLAATKMLLEAKTVTNPRLTIEALTRTRYWYKDNWYGHIYSFVRLDDAKRYAKRETGDSVTIYTSGKDRSGIVCFAPASGYCPP